MSLRGVRETVAKVRSRVETSWARTVAAEQRPLVADPAGDAAFAGPWWPYRFSVGRAASADLGSDFGTYVRQLGEWRDWAKTLDVELIYATRMVAGTRQDVVSHIVVPHLDTAVHLVGGAWPELVATARTRAAVLHHRFPNQPNLHRAVLGATRLSDVDFDVLIHVCDYFLRRAELATAAGVPLVP
jgi:hypothetical protein